MLFKLSLSNIRRSLRDYAVYFFTLIIGVAVFYVFNAISGQTAMMRISDSQYEIIKMLDIMLSGVSVFVACVLGLLIVYASRFLMKRRNREFALYMTLGMSKSKISSILLLETVLIGIGSLFVGLLIGIGLSQLMSAVVANLFDADMTAYKFSISGKAIEKTVVYFAVMYLVVMLFNSVIVTKMKLIDLLQSGKKTETVRLKNPLLCVLIFLISAAALGFAYYQVGWKNPDQKMCILCIALGCAATFCIFWSVSGMLLRIVMSMNKVYYKSLNAFTFRQISSKVNTTVFSMTVICLMLFVTICALASSFSLRNSLNRNLREFCTADCEIIWYLGFGEKEDFNGARLPDFYEANGMQVSDGLRDSVQFTTYADSSFTLTTVLGRHLEDAKKQMPASWNSDAILQEIIGVSDYNAVCRFYGREPVTVGTDEYVLLCNYPSQQIWLDRVLADRPDMTIFGKTLHSRYDKCQDGFIDIGSQALNYGLFVVPDDAIDKTHGKADHVAGIYDADTEEERQAVEKRVSEQFDAVKSAWEASHPDTFCYAHLDTKTEIYESAIGLGAIVTFLGLYIGLVFLIACGAILALKELSESADSIGRYEMLRKIGAEERDIHRSLLMQTGIFFLLPLVLASVHAVFGMRFASTILESMGTRQVGASMAATSVIILLIFGGYFLVTYYCSKGIIKERK